MDAFRCLAVIAAVALVPGVLPAQIEPPGMTQKTVVEIERLPNVMRMEVYIQTRADTAEEALKLLNERIEESRRALIASGAAKESVAATNHVVVRPDQDPQREAQRQMLEQMRRASGGAAPKLPSYIALGAYVTAEWTLKGETANDLLLEVATLQEKIIAADLPGATKPADLTPDEQEIMEQLRTSGFGMYGGSQNQQNLPRFMFARAITNEEYDEAIGKACQEMKAKATRMAQVAGSAIGELVAFQEADQVYLSNYIYDGYGQQQTQQFRSKRPSGANQLEAVGFTPTSVAYRVSLTAVYELHAR